MDTPEKQEVIENRTDLFNRFHSLLMESIEQSAEVTCSVEVKEEYPGVENDEMSESYQDGCESLRSVKTGDNPITEQFTNTKHEPVDDINYKSSDADTIDIDTCIFKEEITRVCSEIENSEEEKKFP